VITSSAEQFSDPQLKSSVIALGNNYMDYLEGDNISPEVWKGLWTSEQLGTFDNKAFIPSTLQPSLKKLFTNIGNILSETITLLWQSRQMALVELEEAVKKDPPPGYVGQKHLCIPNTKELRPISPEDMKKLIKSATQVPVCPAVKISLYKTSRRIRPSLDVTSVGENDKESVSSDSEAGVASPNPTYKDTEARNRAAPTTTIKPQSGVIDLTSESEEPNAFSQMKIYKSKRPKQHPSFTPAQRFRINDGKEAKRKQRQARALELRATVSTNPIDTLLRTIPQKTPMPAYKPPPSSCPPSPPKVAGRPGNMTGTRTNYSKLPSLDKLITTAVERTETSQCPIRGHDPP
jgi:hypothetical protein